MTAGELPALSLVPWDDEEAASAAVQLPADLVASSDRADARGAVSSTAARPVVPRASSGSPEPESSSSAGVGEGSVRGSEGSVGSTPSRSDSAARDRRPDPAPAHLTLVPPVVGALAVQARPAPALWVPEPGSARRRRRREGPLILTADCDRSKSLDEPAPVFDEEPPGADLVPSNSARPVPTSGSTSPAGHIGPVETSPVGAARWQGSEEPAARPTSGWRGALYLASGGLVNPGLSRQERELAELREYIRRRLRPQNGAFKIVTTCMKGGVGKTTVAAGLGLVLAEERRTDKVIAVDINPDGGTLYQRLIGQRPWSSVQVFLDELALGQVRGINAMNRFVGLTPNGLAVLAGFPDGSTGESFIAEDYDVLLTALSRYYNVAITDGGTGLDDSAMRSTFDQADALVLVTNPTVDGLEHAEMTMNKIHDRFAYLASRCVMVLCCDRVASGVVIQDVVEHFRGRCRAVVVLPRDDQLGHGGVVRLEQLAETTRTAFMQVAAFVTDPA